MNKIKLGDVLDFKRGMSVGGEFYSNEGRYVRLTLGNFSYPECGFKLNTSKDDIYYTGTIRKEFLMKKGDIITPLTEQVRGLLGNTATIPDDDLYIQTQDIAKLIPDLEKIDKRFAYYLVSSHMVKKQLDAGSQQTKIRHTSPDKLKDCYAYIPEDINIQKKIAKVLDTINNKIEINNRINTELESLAKTLYDYWFLQFEFPNAEGKPYKSSGGKMVYNEQLKKEIPEGWEVHTLSEITHMYQPSTFDAKLLEDNGMYRVYGAGGYMGQYHEYNHEEQKIFISCRGSCGNIYKSMPKSLITGNAMIVHPFDKLLFDYLYLTLLRYGVRQCITGSVQPQITRDSLNDWKLILPPQNLLQKFNLIVIPMSLQLNNIIDENQELTSLRDFLLPLLMNGQVTIQDAEEQVKNTISNLWNAEKLLRFAQWKQLQGYAARGEVDEETLMKIFDAMDKDAKN